MQTKSFKLILPLLFLCAVTMLISSCKKDSTSSGKKIKVGVLLGFSGTGSQNAVETQAALTIGLADVRDYIERNGLDASVELFFEDTKTDTNEAKLKAQVLIDKGVRLIIGPYTSAETKAVKAIADAKNVLLVSHSAVSTSLAIPNDNLLRFVPSDFYQAEAMNAMLMSDTIRAIIPVVRNDLWSNSLIAATGSVFVANGGVSLPVHSFAPGTTDFSSLVASVKMAIETASATYDFHEMAIYLISYADGTDFLEALSLAGIPAGIRIYGASAFAQSTALIANTNAAAFATNVNLQCPVFGFDEAAANIYEPIQSRIQSAIGSKASIYALAAYDVLWTTVLASLTQQNDPGFAAFKAHFIETAGDYYGATGRTELDGNGDRKHVFYDFWAVRNENGFDAWKLSAKYNTSGQLLQKF